MTRISRKTMAITSRMCSAPPSVVVVTIPISQSSTSRTTRNMIMVELLRPSLSGPDSEIDANRIRWQPVAPRAYDRGHVQEFSRAGALVPARDVDGVVRLCRLPDRPWRHRHCRPAQARVDADGRSVLRRRDAEPYSDRDCDADGSRTRHRRATRTGTAGADGGEQRLSVGAIGILELDCDAHRHDRSSPGPGGAPSHTRARHAEGERARSAGRRGAAGQATARHPPGTERAPDDGAGAARGGASRVWLGDVPAGTARLRLPSRADVAAAAGRGVAGGQEAPERLLAADARLRPVCRVYVLRGTGAVPAELRRIRSLRRGHRADRGRGALRDSRDARLSGEAATDRAADGGGAAAVARAGGGVEEDDRQRLPRLRTGADDDRRRGARLLRALRPQAVRPLPGLRDAAQRVLPLLPEVRDGHGGLGLARAK